MGMTSGSSIATSLPKICPSSNLCLPQKGTPPRAFLQVTTPARSAGKVLVHWRTILLELPVEDVLVAILLMMDNETNSGVMEQCHDNMNDEDCEDIDVVTPD